MKQAVPDHEIPIFERNHQRLAEADCAQLRRVTTPAASSPRSLNQRLSGKCQSVTAHLGSSAGSMVMSPGPPVPAYAIDDQNAIKVTDGIVEVVFEGHWKHFAG